MALRWQLGGRPLGPGKNTTQAERDWARCERAHMDVQAYEGLGAATTELASYLGAGDTTGEAG